MKRKIFALGLGIYGLLNSFSNVYCNDVSSESWNEIFREKSICSLEDYLYSDLEEHSKIENPQLVVQREIKKGDTIEHISSKTGIPSERILSENNIDDPRKIQIGQILNIVYENVWGFNGDTEHDFKIVKKMPYLEFKNFKEIVGNLSLEAIIGAKVGKAILDNPSTEIDERILEINEYESFFEIASKKYGVESTLLKTVMMIESGGLENTISTTWRYGTMGLSENIWGQGEWGHKMIFHEGINPYDVEKAINRSASFLSYLINDIYSSPNYEFSKTLSLIGYNQGETELNRQIRAYSKSIGYVGEISSKESFKFLKNAAKTNDSYKNILEGIINIKIKGKSFSYEGKKYPLIIEKNIDAIKQHKIPQLKDKEWYVQRKDDLYVMNP